MAASHPKAPNVVGWAGLGRDILRFTCHKVLARAARVRKNHRGEQVHGWESRDVSRALFSF